VRLANSISYDITDKSNPKKLSWASYTGAAYVHQGWFIDDKWHQYIVQDDEYDEKRRTGLASDGHAVTYIWVSTVCSEVNFDVKLILAIQDVSDLTAPKQTGYYKSKDVSIDHNQYIVDGLSFQSNYASGLHVLDVRSIPKDPTGKGVHEVGFFDIYPEDDADGGLDVFHGTWSSYAYFKSGYIFVNTIERGGWVLKMQNRP
jgi:hypothetical protein